MTRQITKKNVVTVVIFFLTVVIFFLTVVIFFLSRRSD